MPTPRQYWLMKSEPFKYPFAQLVRDGTTMWDGVRNYEARNNLRAMKVGDLGLFYHSNDGKAVVGVARIKRAAYPDPTAPGEDWSVVDLEPVTPLKAHVTLDAIRGEADLAECALLKKPRISVIPVSKPQFDRILRMGKTAVAADDGGASSVAPSPKPAGARAKRPASAGSTGTVKRAARPATRPAKKRAAVTKQTAPKRRAKSAAKSRTRQTGA